MEWRQLAPNECQCQINILKVPLKACINSFSLFGFIFNNTADNKGENMKTPRDSTSDRNDFPDCVLTITKPRKGYSMAGWCQILQPFLSPSSPIHWGRTSSGRKATNSSEPMIKVKWYHISVSGWQWVKFITVSNLGSSLAPQNSKGWQHLELETHFFIKSCTIFCVKDFLWGHNPFGLQTSHT